jgi:hypothetical protein
MRWRLPVGGNYGWVARAVLMLPGRYKAPASEAAATRARQEGEVRKAKYEGERLPHKWPGQEEKNFLRG